MKTRMVLVIVLATVIAIGLSVPLLSSYALQRGFFGNMHPATGNNPYSGNNGMMGGYSGYGGTSGSSGYGRGMMGGGGYGGMMGGSGYGGGMMGNFGTGSYNGMMGGFGNGRYAGSMTGGLNGSYYGMMTIQGESISIQQATQSVQNPPSYAQITRSNDTISFHLQSINIVALAMMPDAAANLTRTQPPSYSTDDVFVIYGLINPTLVIPKGATVQFTIVNLDNDMYHNLAVSSISPPYSYMSMQGMMYSYWQNGTSSTQYPFASMMGFLPPANYSQGTAHEYSYTLAFNQQGILWYLCTYPGHAESGMYGQIVVSG